MTDDTNSIKEIVRRELSSFLGIEPADIEDDFSLTEELHMKASDLTDFMDVLIRMDIDVSGVDLTEIETFSEFVEALNTHQ